jgi:hypothetical protein
VEWLILQRRSSREVIRGLLRKRLRMDDILHPTRSVSAILKTMVHRQEPVLDPSSNFGFQIADSKLAAIIRNPQSPIPNRRRGSLRRDAEVDRQDHIADAKTVQGDQDRMVARQVGGKCHEYGVLAGDDPLAHASRALVGAENAVPSAGRTGSPCRNEDAGVSAPQSLFGSDRHINGKGSDPFRLALGQAAEIAPQPVEDLVKGRRERLKGPHQGDVLQIGRPLFADKGGGPGLSDVWSPRCRGSGPLCDLPVVCPAPGWISKYGIGLLNVEKRPQASTVVVRMECPRPPPICSLDFIDRGSGCDSQDGVVVFRHRDPLAGRPWGATSIDRDFPFDLIDCAPARYTSYGTQALHPISIALVIHSGLCSGGDGM